jgi:hypothetical protein
LAVATLTLALSLEGRGERISTSHYQIQTDLDPDLAKTLAIQMDAMYDEYARRFAGLAPSPGGAPFRVYLFANRADYLRFTGPLYQNTGGLFMPRRGALAAFLEGQGREGLRRTLQHEAFHQFTHAAMGRQLPPWLNEGLAQVFEESIWTGDGFLLYQVPPRRVRRSIADRSAGRLIPFTTFATLTDEQWSAAFTGDPSRGEAQYNQAWAMVQFLARSTDAGGRPRLPRLIALLQLLHEGRNSAIAFKEIFPDGAELNREFSSFVAQLRPTAAAELLERQSVLADFVGELVLRGQLPRELIDAREILQTGGYRLHYSRGDLQWDSDADIGTYFADPSGRMLSSIDLHFELSSREFPDIVCRWTGGIRLRTRFRSTDGRLEHDTMVEQF